MTHRVEHLRRLWWDSPLWLRWIVLLGLFAVTVALTWFLRWGQLPATPFYPLVLLAIAGGTEWQGYTLTGLSAAASYALVVLIPTNTSYVPKVFDSVVLILVGSVLIVAMRQQRGVEHLMKRAVYETGVIRALGSYALTRLSRNEMMQALVRYLANSTDADSAFVVMPSPDGQQLEGYIDDNSHGKGARPVVRAYEGTVAGEVFRHGQARVIDDTLREPMYSAGDTVGLRSLVIVPLRLAEQSIGVLAVGKRMPYGFSEDDVRLLDILGHGISVPLYASQPPRTRTRSTPPPPDS